MPLVYGMQALMENKVTHGQHEIVWRQPPMAFLQNHLEEIVAYYSGIFSMCDYDPQKIGKTIKVMPRRFPGSKWPLQVSCKWCMVQDAKPLEHGKTQTALMQSAFFGPSGATRTPGLLNPNQARYHLRYTRIGGLSLLLWQGLQAGIATLCIIEEISCKCKVRMRIDRRKFPCYTVPDCRFTRFVGGGTI